MKRTCHPVTLPAQAVGFQEPRVHMYTTPGPRLGNYVCISEASKDLSVNTGSRCLSIGTWGHPGGEGGPRFACASTSVADAEGREGEIMSARATATANHVRFDPGGPTGLAKKRRAQSSVSPWPIL
jgi:hypothetical protein